MATSFDVTGTIVVIGKTEQVKETFRKRDLVIEIQDGNYPQWIKFQATQDRCVTLDNYKVGQQVKVCFNLRGRPFQNREGQTVYFTNLEAWRIEAIGAGAPQSTDYSQVQQASNKTDDFDDVPF